MCRGSVDGWAAVTDGVLGGADGDADGGADGSTDSGTDGCADSGANGGADGHPDGATNYVPDRSADSGMHSWYIPNRQCRMCSLPGRHVQCRLQRALLHRV
jgi:hypothetical protein